MRNDHPSSKHYLHHRQTQQIDSTIQINDDDDNTNRQLQTLKLSTLLHRSSVTYADYPLFVIPTNDIGARLSVATGLVNGNVNDNRCGNENGHGNNGRGYNNSSSSNINTDSNNSNNNNNIINNNIDEEVVKSKAAVEMKSTAEKSSFRSITYRESLTLYHQHRTWIEHMITNVLRDVQTKYGSDVNIVTGRNVNMNDGCNSSSSSSSSRRRRTH